MTNRQDHDRDRRRRLGVIAVQPQRDVGERKHGDGDHDRGVRVGGPARLRSRLGRRSQSKNRSRGEHRHHRTADEHVRAGVPELASPGASSPPMTEATSKRAASTYATIGKSVSGGWNGLPPPSQSLERPAPQRDRRSNGDRHMRNSSAQLPVRRRSRSQETSIVNHSCLK